ncbi:MAG: alpha-ketoglutarate decarboxylase [Cryobacterium sp.]|nr:alpha-ketoglutarate decarboxylase [Cryobacterium sp.]
MTDCGCEKAKAELEEFVRNELAHCDADDIREHIENCVECSGEATVAKVLTEAVQRACRETAPEELRSQVLESIREVQTH